MNRNQSMKPARRSRALAITVSVLCTIALAFGLAPYRPAAYSDSDEVMKKTKPINEDQATPGVASEFYAVYNEAAEGEKPAQTMSFYYDVNRESRTGEKYAGLPTEATEAEDCGYIEIRNLVNNVVIDESVKNYKGLKSTAYMFFDMENAGSISGCEYLDVSNVTNMAYMFFNFACNSTSKVQALDLSKWNITALTSAEGMFNGYAAANIEGDPIVYGTDWSSAKTLDASKSLDMFTGSKLRNVDKEASGKDQWTFANTGATGCFTVKTVTESSDKKDQETPPDPELSIPSDGAVKVTEDTKKGLSKAQAAAAEYYNKKSGATDVQINFKVEAAQNTESSDVALIKQKIGNDELVAYNVSLTVDYIDSQGEAVTGVDYGSINEVNIPVTYQFDFTNKTNVKVHQVHNGNYQELTTGGNESYMCDASSNTITVNAYKYSTYAISYKVTDSEAPDTGDPSLVWIAVLALASVAAACGIFIASRMRRIVE